MRLAGIGWLISLVLAYISGALAAAVSSPTSTPARRWRPRRSRTLIPILKDMSETQTRFGTYLLGAGAAEEFGPILLVTLILSTTHPVHEALILILFVAVASSPASSPFARPGRAGR